MHPYLTSEDAFRAERLKQSAKKSKIMKSVKFSGYRLISDVVLFVSASPNML